MESELKTNLAICAGYAGQRGATSKQISYLAKLIESAPNAESAGADWRLGASRDQRQELSKAMASELIEKYKRAAA